MFCPQCKLEYREGYTVCTECEVPLVESLAAEPEGDPGPLDLETVFETGDPGMLSLAHSLLDEEQIPYLTQGEGLQDLFGMGRLGTGFSTLVGPVHIQVERERVEEARALLARIEEHPEATEPAAAEEPGDSPSEP